MIGVGTLFVKFGADLSEFMQGAGVVDKRLDGVGKRVSSVGLSMTKWVAGPIVAATTGLLAAAKAAGGYADRIGDLTDITGMSAKSIQEWQYIAKIGGVETEAVTTAVEGLIRRLPQMGAEEGLAAKQSARLSAESVKVAAQLAKLRNEGKEGSEQFANLQDRAVGITEELAALEVGGGRITQQLSKLGLTFADLQSMTPDKMIATLIGRMSAMEDPLERNAVGSKLFGGAWKDIAPILGMGAGAIEEARRRANELGVVMGDEALAEADKFQKALVELSAALGGMVRNIGAELAPVITDVLLPAIREQIVPAITDFAARVGDLIRWFVELDPKWKTMIGYAIATAIAIGPVLAAVGNLTKLGALLIPVIKGIGAALAFLSANPIGIAILAIGALVLAGVAIWKNWDLVKSKLLAIWGGILTGVKGFVNIFVRALNWMIGGLNKLNFTIPSWVPLIGGKNFGFKLAEIPLLHGGGEFRAPTPGGEGLALLRDREVVLPAGAAPGSGLSLPERIAIDMTIKVEGGSVDEATLTRIAAAGLIDLIRSGDRRLPTRPAISGVAW